MVARLHERDLISSLLTSRTKLNKQTLTEEADAKIDIYNYAARFDCTPKFEERALQRGGKGRDYKAKVIEVTIELSEQNIRVVARGQGLRAAEISAALLFKGKAEKYNAERGEGSIVIKDSTALTNANSRKFFEFYKIIHPKANVVVNYEDMREEGLGVNNWRAQVEIDGQPVGESVEMPSKSKAEDLAFLTAAVAIKKQHPNLHPDYVRALKLGNGNILGPIPPGDMRVDENCVELMRQTIFDARRAGLPDQIKRLATDETIPESGGISHYLMPLGPQQAERRDLFMKQARLKYIQDPNLKQIRDKRSELPMNQYAGRVLDIITNNSYSIIVGATGSGKTTQVPQILIEEAISKGEGSTCNIICTQPRRIAATSVARRVAEERAERLQDTVGYHVRFDHKPPSTRGSITFCTTGILLRQLQNSPDEIMNSTSHLIIDEVHERDIATDFLLVTLKKVMKQRAATGQPTPKVVLMSATMDTELFASYFTNIHVDQGVVRTCPVLSVPGRTFPVKKRDLDNILKEMRNSYPASSLQLLNRDNETRDYLEANDRFCREQPAAKGTAVNDSSQNDEFIIDWKQERKISAEGEVVINEKDDAFVPHGLVALTVAHIAKTTHEGAVLVFVPGLAEIVKVEKLLTEKPLGVDFTDTSKFKISMLHSSIPASQTEVFDPVPKGCRKIILATNIAETSITIPDVQFVVDTGKLREKQYDQTLRITQLKCTWISKSNSKQRAGRAGRVQNGHYFALFPKARYDSMRAIGLPEILRSDLQEICLAIKAQAFTSPIREFLAEAIEPPAPKAVDASVMNLLALDALTPDEKLTPLGRLLASLPVHPSLGKMIVLGVIFRCFDPMLILGAAAAERQMFIAPLERRQQAQKAKLSFVEGSGSDHIALLNAFREMRATRDRSGESAMRNFAMDNFIHINAFKTIDNTARQVEDILIQEGLIPFTPPSSRVASRFGDRLLNENSSKVPLIKALTLAGLHPNLAISTSSRAFRTPREKNVIMHPSSVNAGRERGEESSIRRGTIYSFSAMAKSNDGNAIFLRDTTESTPLMSTLFGGKVTQQNRNILEIDGWLPWYVKSSHRRAIQTIVEFRQALERLLSHAFRDLAVQRSARKQGDMRAFLAVEKVRTRFAEGLVKVLDLDKAVREGHGASASRGSSRESLQRSPPSRGKTYDRKNGLGFYNDLILGENAFKR